MDNKTIQIDLNCDLGEGIGNEKDLMPLISSCNIACGGHTGSLQSMNDVAALAKEHGVKVGAHPSYPDFENFGRVSIKMPKSSLIESIKEQVGVFESVLNNQDIKLNHIKAHGALYNDISYDSDLARTFLEAIENHKYDAFIYVPFGSAIEEEALRKGYKVKREAFADRNYNIDLSLVSRKLPEALITDPIKVFEHLLTMVRERHIVTLEGRKIHVMAETYCVHGDTPNALEILNYLNHELPKANIRIEK